MDNNIEEERSEEKPMNKLNKIPKKINQKKVSKKSGNKNRMLWL